MAKRNADKELTDRNWDQEDDAEEQVGTFSVASEEVLKNRAIKKAKRRAVAFESEGGGAFKGFKGLMVPPGGGGAPAGFGNSTSTSIKPLEGLSNGSTMSSVTPAKTTPEKKATFGRITANGPKSPLGADKTADLKTNGDKQQPSSSSGPSASAYHRQLAALNCSVRDWIVKHVDTNPLCDLTPIFKDYERYLTNIEQLPGNSSEGSGQKEALAGPAAQGPPQLPQDEAPPEKRPASATVATSTTSFHFGQKVDGSVLGPLGSGTAACFSFSPGNSGVFGKGVSQGGSISAFPKVLEGPTDGPANECKGADEEESEEPPKVIVTEVKEEDAFYSKKCKLFYKKDNEFKEKGVGTLHLKPAANQKTQLLVRADTNLGNILLNVLVPPNMPCSRTGKNNVLIVCVPNPPVCEKNASIPVTMLIRVKTTEDADELHKILLEKKEA